MNIEMKQELLSSVKMTLNARINMHFYITILTLLYSLLPTHAPLPTHQPNTIYVVYSLHRLPALTGWPLTTNFTTHITKIPYQH